MKSKIAQNYFDLMYRMAGELYTYIDALSKGIWKLALLVRIDTGLLNGISKLIWNIVYGHTKNNVY